MKNFKTTALLLICLSVFATPVFAIRGIIATVENIIELKRDLLAGKIKIGATRLIAIQNRYGEAPNIIDDDKRITYDYGDLRLTFSRERLLRKWEKDSFHDPVYSNNVDDLRFDIGSGELVGDNITFSSIRRSYGEPTESHESVRDGETSIYYYGDIKLTFENVISIKSWRGTNLDVVNQYGVGFSDVFVSSAPELVPVPELPPEEIAAE